MDETTGPELGVFQIIDQLSQRLSSIKICCEDFGSLPENWHSSIKSFEYCKKGLIRTQMTLARDWDSVGECSRETVLTILKEIEPSLSKAETILKGLEEEFAKQGPPVSLTESSRFAGSSSKPSGLFLRSRKRLVDGRLVNNGKLSLIVRMVISALEEVDAICKVAHPAIDRVALHLATVIDSRNFSSDKYLAHFDAPSLPNNVVLNFSGDTMEACLKRAVLLDSARGRVTAAVGRNVLGAVGMGGVGKTIALKGLCYEPEVQNKYFDGVFYVSLGQDVAQEDVMEGLAHFVESSGGKSLTRDIAKKSSVDSAARQASLWFKDKCALFVCDDIWSFDGHPTGYLSSLRLLMNMSPSSAMVISTREKSIMQHFVEVKFSPREVRGHQASHILAKYAGIQADAVRVSTDAWTAFEYILDVCAGLPVALAAAGTSLRNSIRESRGTTSNAIGIYAHELNENIESVGDKTVDDYRGFHAVIETSLRHCEKWARSAEGRSILGYEVNVREKFEALSAVRRQGWIPRACLKRLWGTDERATKQLMSKLSDMHLVLRQRHATSIGEVDKLALHDLVLERARKLAIENNRTRLWHARILDGYMRKAAGNVLMSEKYYCREWWDCEKVPDDGYIEKNLARHLVTSNASELEYLLSDIRWTKRRMKAGGIVALRDDFQELSRSSERPIGIDAVRSALEECWVNINKSLHAIPFEIYGRLQSQCSSSPFVKRFVSSASMHIPKPYYLPKRGLRWKVDAEQLLRIDFDEQVRAMCLSKDQNTIAVTQAHDIHVFGVKAMCTICILRGHVGKITGVAMSADATRIISGSWDKSVRVWDGQSGECVLGPLLGHEEKVNCVAVSSDGSRVVSGSWDKTVRVWDGQTGECLLGPLRGHEDKLECIAISCDGSRIVSGSWDATVRVWDGQSGECMLGPLRGHERSVRSVAMSGDGSRIVTGSFDKSVRVWNGQSGDCVLGPLRGHEDTVGSVAVTSDGGRIGSASADKTIIVWDGRTGERLLGPFRGHEAPVRYIAMSGDGSRIVSGSLDKTVRVWNGQINECELEPHRVHDRTVRQDAVSEDGSRLVSGYRDKAVRVWDGQSKECALGPIGGHENIVTCVALSSDGSRIVSGSADKSVRVWDGKSGTCVLGPLCSHQAPVRCVAISPDGSRIISGSDDKSILVWDGQSGECLQGPLCGHKGRVQCVAISGDTNRIISGSVDRSVRVWNTHSGNCIVGPLFGHELEVTCVSTSNNGSRIVSRSWDGGVLIWDGQSGECILGPLRGPETVAITVAISSDGSRIVVGYDDKSVRVLDSRSGECVLGPLRGHENIVTYVAISGNGSRIVSASLDKEAILWDAQTGECILEPLRGNERAATCITMSGDGNRVVSGHRDKSLRVWDGQSGECVLGPLHGHEASVRCVSISDDGSRMVSGSWDTTVRVWDGRNGKFVLGPLHGHDGLVQCVAVSGDGSRIVSGSADKTIVVWDGRSGACLLGPLNGHHDRVQCVAMNSDGSRIISGSWDKSIRVWNGQSGECMLGPLRGHEGIVTCVAMSDDGSHILSGSGDKMVRVWDGNTGHAKSESLQCAGRIASLELNAGSCLCVEHMLDKDFLLDTSTGTNVHRPGYIMFGSYGRIYVTGKNSMVQVATMPFECVTFTCSNVHSRAAAGLADGQVVIGKLFL